MAMYDSKCVNITSYFKIYLYEYILLAFRSGAVGGGTFSLPIFIDKCVYQD